MNIHNATKYGPRPKNYKARNTAKTPRTRDGQTYPGGRPMRRALKRLAEATAFYEKVGSHGRGAKNQSGFTKPGAMRP